MNKILSVNSIRDMMKCWSSESN